MMTRQRRRAFARQSKKRDKAGYPKVLNVQEYMALIMSPEGKKSLTNKFLRFYGLNNKYLGNGELR